MFKKGDCFDFNGIIIQVVEVKEEVCKVKYCTPNDNSYRKEGFISQELLEYLPTFPF